MSIHVALHHKTRYRYERPVTLGPQVVRLRPAPHSRSRVLSYSLKILPTDHFINWQQDPQSNYLARLVFPEKTKEFSVEVDLVVEMAVFNPFDFFLEPGCEQVPFSYDAALDHELAPFLLRNDYGPRFADYVVKTRMSLMSPNEKREMPQTNNFLVALNQQIFNAVRYEIRLEPGVQTPEETLVKGSGSCRDSAWLLVQLLRHLGFASRFVSGYLIQLAADEKSLDGPSGPEADFTDLHAWCEVYLPGAGWVGLDATSGLFCGEGHIPLAATPDPQSAAPISGGVELCETEFDFEMSVKRIFESPRVTKPYSEEQWNEINALGNQVDQVLEAGEVRLTMGGEPTFVSIDDMEGDEWNTLALGPMKAVLADELTKRLKARFAPGGFLHYGQGKWYPGESLPRWSYGCFWRKDGVAIWDHPELFADIKKDYGVTAQTAEKFIKALTVRLGVESTYAKEAYEDLFYYLWKERRLPVNVDPFKSNLKDEEERNRIAKVFDQGLNSVVGYYLPLRRGYTHEAQPWVSGPLYLRGESCFLIPGDSPMGLRLPLDSQPWVAENEYPHLHQEDPMDFREPFAPRNTVLRMQTPGAIIRAEEAAGRFPGGEPQSSPFAPLMATVREAAPSPVAFAEQPHPKVSGEATDDAESATAAEETLAQPPVSPLNPRPPERGESAPWVVRTALCVEPREGRLHVFMPPQRSMADYLELLHAVEDVAVALKQPLVLEGYTPPYDPRVAVLKVTPDPGVIEVNIQPTHDWKELVDVTNIIYEEAKLTRLGTDKFMVDGRHTGTGGGNHIVLGGATPEESPFLRRPDLLRSMVSYWQNHPSLSYLFSGLFMGPTSQSPRADEGRHDALDELEIAFEQIPSRGFVPPWLVDRLFRNFLVDATGNTHRAEFCIDKLFSPDSATGRLGLLEMRAYEMPPHPQMSLAQALLLRTLLARFWEQPYTAPLIRWGTRLHDQWMLPHFVWSDLEDIIQETQAAGFPIKAEWFAPHLEFRFPICGDLVGRNVWMELRHALEPWHVLGEEGGGGGTVRYVDSSLERLQVKVRGITEGRHLITCNGHALPLHPTGTQSEFVAGVRFRAWQPPNCLHPTIPVHAPLVFDLVDTWNRRSLAGCTYLVSHPGGRSHETFPVNAFEAESRRLERFLRHGHTPGTLTPEPPKIDPLFPLTLDLRTKKFP